MSEPRELSVVYDDGTTRTIDFSELNSKLQSELAKLGICPPPSRVGKSKHYALLEWDGWREVVGIDHETVDLLRYYVIRRIEDRGRLSFEVGSEDPELSIVKRVPRELRAVILMGTKGTRVYDLTAEAESWEGIFEAGGKIEYLKYDKHDPRYHKVSREMGEGVKKIEESLIAELAKRSLDPQALVSLDEAVKIEIYREIARAMGIQGMKKQEDVYGFIDFLINYLKRDQTV